MVNNHKYKNSRAGFTLIELMIAVAVIGILAAIAYPSYQQYVIKTKRTAMMTDLQNIGSQIQSQKLAKGSYSNITTTGLIGNYPQQGTPLYKVSITPNPLTADWIITADPTDATIQPASLMKNDGILTFNAQGIKCRDTVCGRANEWN